MLVNIERSFARLSENSGAEKQELRSYRTGFVSPVDKKERHTTSGMSRPLTSMTSCVYLFRVYCIAKKMADKVTKQRTS